MKDKESDSILVVDDNKFALNATAELLKEFGYSVIACKDAANAMSILREKRVDVVISDIVMPDISGPELLVNIHKFNPSIPVILMTAYSESDTAVDAVRKDAFDLITKPFSTEYLINTVRKALGHTGLKEMRSCNGEFGNRMQKGTTETIDEIIEMQKADVKRFSKSAGYWLKSNSKNEY